MKRFAGGVAIVADPGTGLGSIMSTMLAGEGAKVVLAPK